MHIQTGNVAFFEHRSCLFISSVSLVFLRLTVSTQHTHKYTSQVPTTKVALEQVRLFYVTCQPNAALKSLSIYIYIYIYVCVCVCVWVVKLQMHLTDQIVLILRTSQSCNIYKCSCMQWIRDLKCISCFICGCWCVKVCVDKYMLEHECVCVC